MSLALVALIGVTMVVAWVTPVVAVRDFEIQGNSIVNESDISDALETYRDRPLPQVNIANAEAIIDDIAAVEEVEITRSWPRTLTIELQERRPYLLVPEAEESYWVIDRNGVPYQHLEEPDPALMQVELESPGEDDRATQSVLTILESLPSDLHNQLEKVESPTASGIVLHLEDEKSIRWGDAAENEKKSQVALLLLSQDHEHFDVSAPNAPSVS